MADEKGGQERGSGGGAPGFDGNSRRGLKERGAIPVVALRMEDITVWAIERVAKMPREHKSLVGDKLVEACLGVTTLLVEASFVRDKAGLLAQASRGLTRARVLVRMARRLRLLSDAQQEHFNDQTVEIGKMVGGWARSLHARAAPA